MAASGEVPGSSQRPSVSTADSCATLERSEARQFELYLELAQDRYNLKKHPNVAF
jgi:hypothetical protein